jgi:hypothetical protein
VSPETLARRYAAGPLVAFHEAGHAVVAHRLGYRVERVHVGYARDSGQTDIAPAYNPLRRALITLAGDRAERRSVSWLPGMEALGGDDDRRQLQLARDELPDWSLAELVERTDDMLRDNWRALERLARKLQDVSTLTGQQVAELLG